MVEGGTPTDYGNYTLSEAQMLTMPQLTPQGTIDWFGDPPQGPAFGGNGKGQKRKLSNATQPSGKKKPRIAPAPVPIIPLPPAPPPLPPISSVGVMDIGQGNCNVLIDQTPQPVTYYDAGYPLWFYLGSLPVNMRFGNLAYTGPYQAVGAGAGMNVVLSHWDWDHWRLGAVAGLQGLQWMVPNQPVGPAALGFFNLLGVNATVWPPGTPSIAVANYTMFRCQPLPGMPPASIMNNSGIAIGLWTRFPNAGPALPGNNWHQVVLTADANFNTLSSVYGAAVPAFLNAVGVTAVHHGSNNYGAPNNLPNPVYAGAGRIAYSTGQLAGGGHPYGFPNPAAVLNYQAAGWLQERSTAEGPNINAGVNPPGARGNIRMANQAALGWAACAFTVFAGPSQLP